MPKVTEEHREARRQQILAAAMRCAARDGFHKTTMSAVVKESGLSAGAVYLYFRSKNDLLQELAGRAVAGIADAIGELADADELPTPEKAVRAAVERVVELGRQLDVDLPRLALQAWAEAARDPEVRALVAGEAVAIRAAWGDYAQRAIAGGNFPADADPAAIGFALMAQIPGFILFQVIFPGEVTPPSYAAAIAELRHLP